MYNRLMKFRIFLVVGVILSTIVIVPAEVLALSDMVAITFHNAYIGHFIDKTTFLVNCL